MKKNMRTAITSWDYCNEIEQIWFFCFPWLHSSHMLQMTAHF